MKHTHKSGAWFELPDDITQKQLETYERVTSEKLEREKRTDARVARAALEGAFEAGFVTPGDGVPKSKEELADFKSSKVMYWMAVKLGAYITELKTVDPN